MNLLQKLRKSLVEVAVNLGINQQLADDLGYAFIEKITVVNGGMSFYLPKIDKQIRNRQIKAIFNGKNHDQICKKFNISKSTLYKVLK